MLDELGFTGSRAGMTPAQRARVREALLRFRPGVFRHGGCYGADTQAHEIAVAVRRAHGWLRIVVHPDRGAARHAWRYAGTDAACEPQPPLMRNQAIVDAVAKHGHAGALLAAPDTTTERRRSGTWATIRRARARGVRIYLLHPDGSIHPDQP